MNDVQPRTTPAATKLMTSPLVSCVRTCIKIPVQSKRNPRMNAGHMRRFMSPLPAVGVMTVWIVFRRPAFAPLIFFFPALKPFPVILSLLIRIRKSFTKFPTKTETGADRKDNPSGCSRSSGQILTRSSSNLAQADNCYRNTKNC